MMENTAYPQVSIVMTHWNAGTKTQTALGQFYDWDYPLENLEILVLDNASTDGSSDALAQFVQTLRGKSLNIKYHRLEQHPGLTAALNFALTLLNPDAKYLMRLDNDVLLDANALSNLVALMETREDTGLVGPRLVYTSQPTLLNGGALWLNRWGGKGRNEDRAEATECDTVLGAIMVFRRSAIQEIGRWFDPELYLFAEEPEISWQLRRKGYKTVFEPKAFGHHDTKVSLGKHSALSTYLNYRNHTLLHRRMHSFGVILCRNIQLVPRILVRCLRNRSVVPLLGVIDGLLGRQLNVAWWEEMITNKKFRRPATKR